MGFDQNLFLRKSLLLVIGATLLFFGPVNAAFSAPVDDPCANANATASTGRGPRKLAFLVGIESYADPRQPSVPRGQEWSRLRGPRNDLTAMASILREQGFDVQCLFDKAATRDAILSGWREHLVKRVESKDDVALFYFSGHGYQITDGPDRDEVDGLDEVLVPYDHRGHDPSGFLTDDQVREVAAEVEAKTDNLVVILDSCHSGSATRGPLAARGKTTDAPPAKTPLAKKPAKESFARGSVVLTAARAEQTAREWSDPQSNTVFGAFTYLLVDALREASERGAQVTYGDLLREIAARLPSLGTEQEPLIEGEPDRIVFSGALLARPKAFELGPLEPRKHTRLEGGVVHGLAAGTKLALFERGTSLATIDEKQIAAAPRLVVRRTHVASAFVEPIDGRGQKLSTKARENLSERFRRGGLAVVVEIPPGQKLKVWAEVDRSAVEKMIARHIDGGAPFAFVGQGTDWDIHVRKVPDTEICSCQTAKAKLSNAAELERCRNQAPRNAFQLIDRGGTVVPIPLAPGSTPVRCLSIGDEKTTTRIAQALRAYDSRKQIIGLDTRRGERGLDIDIRIEPRGEKFDGSGCAPEPGNDVTTALGTRMSPNRCFTIGVTNNETRPVYVSVLVIDPDLSVKRLFPRPRDTDDIILAGQSRALGPFFTELPTGDTLFKVIATEASRVDTRMLTYEPEDLRTRGEGVKRGGPKGALEQMLFIRGTGLRTGAVQPPEAWGSAEAKLTVVKSD